MTALYLESRSLTVCTVCANNLTKIFPANVIEACPKVTALDLEHRSLAVFANCLVFCLYAINVPISVCADFYLITVCTNSLVLGLLTVVIPIAVCTDSVVIAILTESLVLGLNTVKIPVAVCTDSVLISILCNSLVLGLFTVEVPVTVCTDSEVVTVCTNCLVLGLFAIEVPISVGTDVVRKSVIDSDHIVADIRCDKASRNKLILIFSSKCCADVSGNSVEYFAVCKNKLSINVRICACYGNSLKSILNIAVCRSYKLTAVYGYLYVSYNSCGSIADCDN